jgi:hypothetical protein
MALCLLFLSGCGSGVESPGRSKENAGALPQENAATDLPQAASEGSHAVSPPKDNALTDP